MKKIVNIRHFAGINVLNALTPSIRSSFQVVDVKYRWRSLWRSGFFYVSLRSLSSNQSNSHMLWQIVILINLPSKPKT